MSQKQTSLLKPFLLGLALGAAGLGIGGQWLPGYQLDSTAEDAVSNALSQGRVQTLALFCAAKARGDPDASLLTTISAQSSAYQRVTDISKTSWIQFTDIELSNSEARKVAEACDKILREESPA